MSTSSTMDARTGNYADLVRSNADFRWLWLGQIASLLGDWFNLIASVALVASLTHSGLAVGGFFVVRKVAPFLTSPLAGVVADRFSRRSILMVADIARGLIVLGMLLVHSAESMWLLYLLTALQSGTSSFFVTARNALLPDIVAPRDLGTANALTSATWSAMLAVGAALGGLAAGWFGVYAAFLVDASTFLISAVMVAQIHARSRPVVDGRASATEALREYRESLRYLGRHPEILAVALHKTALTLLVGTTLRVVQAFAADRVFSDGQPGSLAIGLMFTAAGVGAAIGPLAARLFTGDDEWRLRWGLLGGYLSGFAGLAISAHGPALEVMTAGAFVAGMGNGILWVFSTQLLLLLVEPSIRGRIFGAEFALFALASAVGSAVVGAAVDSPLGVSGVLSAMATLTLLPAAAWALWLMSRRARRLEEVETPRPTDRPKTSGSADVETDRSIPRRTRTAAVCPAQTSCWRLTP